MVRGTVDKNVAYPKAAAKMKADGELWWRSRLRQVKYLNNILEQDHRRTKRLTGPGLGFGGFWTARRTLAGFALRAMCGRPLGCKKRNEKSDGRVDCDHVFGLLMRRHDRWPRWGPRSSPKQRRSFESRGTERVLWIVGSTDRHLIQLFHPGIDARFRRLLAVADKPPCASS